MSKRAHEEIHEIRVFYAMLASCWNTSCRIHKILNLRCCWACRVLMKRAIITQVCCFYTRYIMYLLLYCTFVCIYTPCKRSLVWGYTGFTLSVCLSVCLSAPRLWTHDFVNACSKKWVHGFFWKFVHKLPTIWKGAPGIYILIG